MLLSVAVLISCCFYVLAAGESEQIVWQRDEKKVAITFDDGPNPETTTPMLRMLRQQRYCLMGLRQEKCVPPFL